MMLHGRLMSVLYLAAICFAPSLPFAERASSQKPQLRKIADQDLADSLLELKNKLAKQRASTVRENGSPAIDEGRCLSEAAIELRMAVLRAVSQVAVEYGACRNPAFWTEREGVFFPNSTVSPCDAMSDVGDNRTDETETKRLDGIYCTSLAQILLMQGHLAIASSAQRLAWDTEWRQLSAEGNVLPNDIPGVGETRFWVRGHAEETRDGGTLGYLPSDLLPGDNIYIENPYFTDDLARQMEEQKSERYRGEEGSNVFYLGAGPNNEGLLVHPFSHEVYTLDQYRRHMIEEWQSIIDTAGGKAHPSMFRITSKRSPVLTP